MARYVLTSAAVRKLTALLQGKRGDGGVGTSPFAVVDEREFPLPFTVQWSESNSAWLVWLPNLSQLVKYDGQYVSTISGISAASGYPSGWYAVTASSASTTEVWLVITKSASQTTAELDVQQGTATTGETVENILVANTIEAPLTTEKRVKQFLASAVVIASGGSPAVTIPGPFQPVHDATTGLLTGFTHCVYCAERQFVECGTDGEMEISGVTASTSGYVVLTLPHDAYASATASGAQIIDDDNVSVAIENALPMNDSDAVTKIPLYHVTAGVVDVDLRAVPTGVLAR